MKLPKKIIGAKEMLESIKELQPITSANRLDQILAIRLVELEIKVNEIISYLQSLERNESNI